MWHRFQHWLGTIPCRNDAVYINGILWHYVYCLECGATVIAFPSSDIKTCQV